MTGPNGGQRGFGELETLFWALVLFVLFCLFGVLLWEVATTDQVVYRSELVTTGCEDYITLPLLKCKGGTELRITHCRCKRRWVKVEGPEASTVLGKHAVPAGYKVVRE